MEGDRGASGTAITTIRYIRSILLLLTASLLATALSSAQPGTITGTCSLPGTVDWSGISITLEGTNRSIVTNPTGSFNFSGVPAGLVRLRAGKLLYGDTLVTFALSGGSTVPLSLFLSTVVVDTFEGAKTGLLSTASTNSGNIGVPNVYVAAADSGFRWGGIQQLAEGSFMVGISTTQVSDAARTIFGINQDNLDHDFQSRSAVVTLTNGSDSTVQLTAYDDSRSAEPPGSPSKPIGLTITQRTSVFGQSGNNGFVLLEQTIHNDTRFTLTDLVAGWFLDWNAGGAAATNRGAVEILQQQIPGVNNNLPFLTEIAYQQKSTNNGPYVGIVPLSQSYFKAARIASVTKEIAAAAPGGGLSESNKYLYMNARRNGATMMTDFGVQEDLATIVSLGGFDNYDMGSSTFTLGAGEDIVVGFALVGGNSYAELTSNALAAQKKWIAQGHGIMLTPNFWPVGSGWRLVSAPLNSPGVTVATLFPTATSRAFKFAAGYVAVDTLSPGEGYWVKIPADTIVKMTGGLILSDTVSVVPGWNMIGAPSFPARVADLVVDPPGNIISNIYGYGAGYFSATMLDPIQGYWVKCSQAGTIVITAGN